MPRDLLPAMDFLRKLWNFRAPPECQPELQMQFVNRLHRYTTALIFLVYAFVFWGAWTCIWVSVLVFLVHASVFWVSGLVFVCLDLYLCVWACICASGLVFGPMDLYSGYCILVGCPYTCRVSVYLQGVCIPVACDYGVRAPTRITFHPIQQV